MTKTGGWYDTGVFSTSLFRFPECRGFATGDSGCEKAPKNPLATLPHQSAGMPRAPSASRKCRSGEQGGHCLGFDQFAGLLEVVVNDRFRIDAESVIDRGQQFHRMDRVSRRAAASLVGLT